MAEAVDHWLDGLDGMAMRDRRNGSYPRHLPSELGAIELRVPRTRRFCPTEVLKSYARRGQGMIRRRASDDVVDRVCPRTIGLRAAEEGCSVYPIHTIDRQGRRASSCARAMTAS